MFKVGDTVVNGLGQIGTVYYVSKDAVGAKFKGLKYVVEIDGTRKERVYQQYNIRHLTPLEKILE